MSGWLRRREEKEKRERRWKREEGVDVLVESYADVLAVLFSNNGRLHHIPCYTVTLLSGGKRNFFIIMLPMARAQRFELWRSSSTASVSRLLLRREATARLRERFRWSCDRRVSCLDVFAECARVQERAPVGGRQRALRFATVHSSYSCAVVLTDIAYYVRRSASIKVQIERAGE